MPFEMNLKITSRCQFHDSSVEVSENLQCSNRNQMDRHCVEMDTRLFYFHVNFCIFILFHRNVQYLSLEGGLYFVEEITAVKIDVIRGKIVITTESISRTARDMSCNDI